MKTCTKTAITPVEYVQAVWHTILSDRRFCSNYIGKICSGKIILLGIISKVCIARTSSKTASRTQTTMMRRNVSSWAWGGRLALTFGLTAGRHRRTFPLLYAGDGGRSRMLSGLPKWHFFQQMLSSHTPSMSEISECNSACACCLQLLCLPHSFESVVCPPIYIMSTTTDCMNTCWQSRYLMLSTSTCQSTFRQRISTHFVHFFCFPSILVVLGIFLITFFFFIFFFSFFFFFLQQRIFISVHKTRDVKAQIHKAVFALERWTGIFRKVF